MIPVGRSIIIIAVCAVCTFALRALPFFVFGKRKVPELIEKIGTLLPMAIMTTLVVFCIRNVSFFKPGDYLPTFISLAAVTALHLWRKNTLLSITAGTVCYMILVQLVF